MYVPTFFTDPIVRPQTFFTDPPVRGHREIPDLLSWVQCFGTYIAVVTSKHPERMRQLLAYQTLIRLVGVATEAGWPMTRISATKSWAMTKLTGWYSGDHCISQCPLLRG